MATPQKKVTFMPNDPSVNEHEQEENDIGGYEEAVSGTGCGCFRLFGFKWRRNNDNERTFLLHQKGESREAWWVKKLKKVKEMSEVVAGPKWKTFIRKVSGYCSNNRKQKKNQFLYDPHSYALNFDSGGADREEDGLLLGFSARSAAPFADEQRRTGL